MIGWENDIFNVHTNELLNWMPLDQHSGID